MRLADLRAQAVHIVVPREKIRARQFVPMSEVFRDGLRGAPRKLALRGGVEVSPIGKRWKLAANGLPIDHNRRWPAARVS